MTTIERLNKIAQRMLDTALDNPNNFVDALENDDFESLFEKCFEAEVGTEYTEAAYEEAYNSYTIRSVMDEIKTALEEHFADMSAYRRNPLKYYGMNQNDFV